MSIIYLSKQGLDNLKLELNKLKSIDRPNIIIKLLKLETKEIYLKMPNMMLAKEAQGLLEMIQIRK